MQIILIVALLVALLGVLYPYLLYPALIAIIARNRPVSEATLVTPGQPPPRVAILVSAYNEESSIGSKIENFLQQDYPAHLLDLFVGDDGSSDRTADIVEAYKNQRIHLIPVGGRNGKTRVLNHLATLAKADLFVFTDVNCAFRPDAVAHLVRAFANPRIGLVSGRTVITGDAGNSEGLYTRFEQWLKGLESRLGWLCGADGAIYMIRASLYQPLDPSLINDFTHPWQVMLRGYSAHMEPRAICEEPASNEWDREVKRQRRMVAQSIFVARHHVGRLLSRGMWGPAWVLFSHKVCRYMVGAAVVAMFVSVIFLLATISGWLLLFLPVTAGLVWIASRSNAECRRLTAFAWSFLVIHGAYLLGILDYLRGNRYVTWTPRGG